MAIFIPVLIPGSTIRGLDLKYFFIPFVRECITSGTTDVTITSVTISTVSPFICISSTRNTPNSSEVLEIPVVILEVCTRLLPSNTPIVIFEFPTSTASNIIFSLLTPDTLQDKIL